MKAARTAASRDDLDRLIAESPLFERLPPEARARLSERFEPETLPGGGVLMRQGEEADALYLVAVGRLRVSIARDDGQEVVVAELGRGAVVGELALITHEPRAATVTAVRDSQVFKLSTDAFDEVVTQDPNALRDITTEVVRGLVRSFRQGAPTSPVVTVAVVPLDDAPQVDAMDERLQRSFQRLTGSAGHITQTVATAALGDLGRVGADRLAGWFAEREAGHEIVVYEATHEPDAWTEACIRQADLILLVTRAGSPTAMRPIENLVEDHRARLKHRMELVIVHPASTVDPRGTAQFLAGRKPDRHHHVREDRDEDVDRVARLLLGRGIGVVFSGGGARGVAGIGVYRALLEHGVPIDATGGTSIGSLLAGGVARGMTPDDLATQLRAAVLDTSPFDVTFPAVSLAAGRRVTRKIQEAADGLCYEDLWRRTFAVSTNLTSGRPEIHHDGPGWYAIRASFSIPGVFPPVRTPKGDLLVDGGVVDNLPIGVMRATHEGITVIAMDVGRTRDVTAGSIPDDGIVSGWRMLWNRIDPAITERSTAGLGRILMRLTELGSEKTDDLGDLYIRPAVDPFGIADFKAFDRLVQLGYEAGNAALEAWLASEEQRF